MVFSHSPLLRVSLFANPTMAAVRMMTMNESFLQANDDFFVAEVKSHDSFDQLHVFPSREQEERQTALFHLPPSPVCHC